VVQAASGSEGSNWAVSCSAGKEKDEEERRKGACDIDFKGFIKRP